MLDELFERTIGLIGEESFCFLKNKTICVIGLGGVGGTAFECLLRSGFRKFLIVDFDNVSPSNLNRQLLYTYNDIGKAKIEAACNRGKTINPDARINAFNDKVNATSIVNLDKYPVDFVIDAIDDVEGKIAIAKYCLEKNIPFITSLGMANRFSPSEVKVMRLDKTSDDPLAKRVRYLFRKNEISLKDVMCVCSKEIPLHDGKKLNSMMMVPSSAGLNIAEYVINYFINHQK